MSQYTLEFYKDGRCIKSEPIWCALYETAKLTAKGLFESCGGKYDGIVIFDDDPDNAAACDWIGQPFPGSQSQKGTKMKPGDVKTIYQKPITEQEPEGRAKLIKRLRDDYGLEQWLVQFSGDAEPAVERWIKKDGSK